MGSDGDDQRIRVAVVANANVSRQLLDLLGTSGELDAALVNVDDLHRAGSPTDVVLLNVRELGLTGSDVGGLVRAAAPAEVVLLTPTLDDPRIPATAIETGRLTCLVTDVDPAELIQTVQLAAQRRHGYKVEPMLTARERDVLALVAAGLSNRQIARRLGISESTVKTHLTKAYRALGVTSRSEAADWSRRQSAPLA